MGLIYVCLCIWLWSFGACNAFGLRLEVAYGSGLKLELFYCSEPLHAYISELRLNLIYGSGLRLDLVYGSGLRLELVYGPGLKIGACI